MRAFLVAALVLSGAALAGLGDGFGGGATATAGAGAGASVTYPRVDVQVGGYVSITPTVEGGAVSSYSVTAGALPDGLSLNASTGAITGVVTTTALRYGMTGQLGANPDLGEHRFSVTAAGLDIIASVAINVYALAVPTPESLFVGSAEFDSGTNFLDAIDGVTFTKTAGTQDTDLTDTTSPLGYSHKFDGSTYFTRASGPTKPDPVHVTVALMLRHSDSGTGATDQHHVEVGGGSSEGLHIFSQTRRFDGAYMGSSVFPAALLSAEWTSMVISADEGVGITGRRNTVADITSSATTAMVFGTGSIVVGNAAFTPTRLSAAYISEVAYWPRVLDATQAVSVDWAWFRGISLDDWDGLAPTSPSVTITPTAPAYERPVTCTGSYTLTGATTNASLVTWYAYPDGATGECTGTSTYSCAVSVSPASAGEGVETISITATHADGSQVIARQDVGFYVTGARDCFLSQSIDGLSNTTNADNDAVTTWVNLISSDRNITQGTAGSRPTVQEGVGSGVYVQPLVRFDGGDSLADDTAADWTWLHNGTDASLEVLFSATNVGVDGHLLCTNSAGGGFDPAGKGIGWRVVTGSNVLCVHNGSAQIVCANVGNVFTNSKYHLWTIYLDDDAAAGVDMNSYTDGTFRDDGTRSGSYATDGGRPLLVGAEYNPGGTPVTNIAGDMFRIILYQSALSATQRGINKAVDEWALGNTLPVNP